MGQLPAISNNLKPKLESWINKIEKSSSISNYIPLDLDKLSINLQDGQKLKGKTTNEDTSKKSVSLALIYAMERERLILKKTLEFIRNDLKVAIGVSISVAEESLLKSDSYTFFKPSSSCGVSDKKNAIDDILKFKKVPYKWFNYDSWSQTYLKDSYLSNGNQITTQTEVDLSISVDLDLWIGELLKREERISSMYIDIISLFGVSLPNESATTKTGRIRTTNRNSGKNLFSNNLSVYLQYLDSPEAFLTATRQYVGWKLGKSLHQ